APGTRSAGVAVARGRLVLAPSHGLAVRVPALVGQALLRLVGVLVRQPLLEALDRLTNVTADVLQALGAEHQHHDDQHDDPVPDAESRSEEHTSELQSRENLVCRLLLEKKNPRLANN